MAQDLNRVSKRRRVIEDEEDQLGQTDHRQVTSVGQPDLLAPVTSLIEIPGYRYDTPSTATVTRG